MMNGLLKVNFLNAVNGLHVIILQCDHRNLSYLLLHPGTFIFFSQSSFLLFNTICHIFRILLGYIVRPIGDGLDWKGQWLFVVFVEHYVLQSKEYFHINCSPMLIKYRSI